jgi:hypothetical protein
MNYFQDYAHPYLMKQTITIHTLHYASFLTVVEWIRRKQNGIDPEEVLIHLHETKKPEQCLHVGR